MPRNSRKKQNYYKMKGCSKNQKHLGGSNNDLAYTNKNIHTVPNPYLAYTGKGGFSSLSYKPSNIGGTNPAFLQEDLL